MQKTIYLYFLYSITSTLCLHAMVDPNSHIHMPHARILTSEQQQQQIAEFNSRLRQDQSEPQQIEYYRDEITIQLIHMYSIPSQHISPEASKTLKNLANQLR